ncbi:MAG: winged helix-turn-helix transcriptional regulator [Methanomassiliicoccales archaeon]|nr:winged helix-turn-helix transcriptional regulator [Methanomassiliicoccales archaeon]
MDNKIRYSLHGLIIDQPGVHYSAIIKELGLSNGVAGYHLEVLEREGFIRSVRDGMLKCFYSTHVRIPLNRNSTPEELRKEIFNLILEKPDISQKGIIEELGITRKMAGYHINNLIQEGSVEASRDGKFVVYKIKRRNRPSIQRKNGTEGVRY